MRNETTRLAVQTKVMRRKPSVLLLLKKVRHKQEQVCFMTLDEKSLKVPLKKSELKKGRRGGRGRQQEERFLSFLS